MSSGGTQPVEPQQERPAAGVAPMPAWASTALGGARPERYFAAGGAGDDAAAEAEADEHARQASGPVRHGAGPARMPAILPDVVGPALATPWTVVPPSLRAPGGPPARVHVGPEAERAARSVHARAFTVGTDIVLGDRVARGADPDSRAVLAHEAAHARARSPALRRVPDEVTALTIDLGGRSVVLSLADGSTITGGLGECNLTPGEYRAGWDAAGGQLVIDPWPTRDEVIRYTVTGTPSFLSRYQALLGGIVSPVPLVVQGAPTAPGEGEAAPAGDVGAAPGTGEVCEGGLSRAAPVVRVEQDEGTGRFLVYVDDILLLEATGGPDAAINVTSNWTQDTSVFTLRVELSEGQSWSWVDGALERLRIGLPCATIDVVGGTALDTPAPATPPAAPAAPAPGDIDWGDAALAFGRTVAIGLAVIVLVGLAVGAEVVTAGQATWLLIGLAAYAGVSSYAQRREEIDASGVDVSVPETMVTAAGDVVGVSRVIEGVSGYRLGTGAPLSSEARSSALGEGAGTITTIIIGGRAYRAAQARGATIAPRPPSTPPTSEGVTLNQLPDPTPPTPPRPSASPGPVETAARARVPAADRIGFDIWMEQIRTGGRRPGDPETILPRQSQAAIDRIAAERTRAWNERAAEADRGARGRTSDPLRPNLRNSRQEGNVTLRWESVEPSRAEVAQARAVADATGEPVEIFGDTPGLQNYPGIDGVIGNPPRPLSLKASGPTAPPSYARVHAADALAAARGNGYTRVEVHITMEGATMAQVRAAWNSPPPGMRPSFEVFDGNVVAQIVIRCTDGVVRYLPGPTLTTGRVGGPTDDEEER